MIKVTHDIDGGLYQGATADSDHYINWIEPEGKVTGESNSFARYLKHAR